MSYRTDKLGVGTWHTKTSNDNTWGQNWPQVKKFPLIIPDETYECFYQNKQYVWKAAISWSFPCPLQVVSLKLDETYLWHSHNMNPDEVWCRFSSANYSKLAGCQNTPEWLPTKWRQTTWSPVKKTSCIIQCSANPWVVQERRNSSALAMELRLSCTNPSKYGVNFLVTMMYPSKLNSKVYHEMIHTVPWGRTSIPFLQFRLNSNFKESSNCNPNSFLSILVLFLPWKPQRLHNVCIIYCLKFSEYVN